jgi:energy-coupling factor transporter ATP-binding protein EcfA2
MEDANAAPAAVAPERQHHMEQLVRHRRKSMMKLFPTVDDEVRAEEGADDEGGGGCGGGEGDDKESIELHSTFVRKLNTFLGSLGDSVVGADLALPSMEVRLRGVSYRVPRADDGSGKNRIHTIFNSSPLYTMSKFVGGLVACGRGGRPEKRILVKEVLSDINLVLRPKRMYLVLGPPLSGKTSLLKAIAGLLPRGTFKAGSKSGGYAEESYLSGQVLYNNLVCSGDGALGSRRTLFRNLVAFVRQGDLHAPRLTVAETFLFAGRCKDEALRRNNKGTSMDGRVGLTLEGLGLSHVQDTYVGNENIRGVSGGQRRRVTLGEMLVFDTPLLCGDEISTGEFVSPPRSSSCSWVLFVSLPSSIYGANI